MTTELSGDGFRSLNSKFLPEDMALAGVTLSREELSIREMLRIIERDIWLRRLQDRIDREMYRLLITPVPDITVLAPAIGMPTGTITLRAPETMQYVAPADPTNWGATITIHEGPMPNALGD